MSCAQVQAKAGPATDELEAAYIAGAADELQATAQLGDAAAQFARVFADGGATYQQQMQALAQLSEAGARLNRASAAQLARGLALQH